MKIIWLIAAVIIIGGGLWYGLDRLPDRTADNQPPIVTPETPVVTPGWQHYESSTYDFVVDYPEPYSVNAAHAYTALGPSQSIRGVAFIIPSSLTEDTNLSKDTYMSVERLDKADNCSGKRFLDNASKEETVTENGRTYDMAMGGDAGAGNLYDETVYATVSGTYCYGLRLFIHSTNIGNYDPGTVRQFDREDLVDTFAHFRSTFVPGLSD